MEGASQPQALGSMWGISPVVILSGNLYYQETEPILDDPKCSVHVE